MGPNNNTIYLAMLSNNTILLHKLTNTILLHNHALITHRRNVNW